MTRKKGKGKKRKDQEDERGMGQRTVGASSWTVAAINEAPESFLRPGEILI